MFLVISMLILGVNSSPVYTENKMVLAADINLDNENETTTGTKTTTGSVIQPVDIINLSCTQVGNKEVILKWNKYDDVNYFKISYLAEKSGIYKEKKTTNNSFKLKLELGKKYTVFVEGYDIENNLQVKTNKINVCIPKKSELRLTRINGGKVRLNWTKSKNTKQYIIYKKINNRRYKALTKTKKAFWVDNKVKKGNKYKYYVLAVNYISKNKLKTKSSIKNFRITNFVNTHHQKYSYSEMRQDIKQLKNTYANYVQVNIIGKSNDNRNMYDVVIGNPNAKKSMLVVSSIHAREYMTAQLSMAQIEHYLKNYNGKIDGVSVKSVLSKVNIHYIPMANPDGVTISQFGISKIKDRKLREALKKMPGASRTSTWKANARGVDLNRNNDAFFIANYGGSRGSEGYSGPKALSEPETRAIAKLLKKLKNKKTLTSVVNYHAMGSIVYGDSSGGVRKSTSKMYSLARGITGYADSKGAASGGKSVGNLREYVMYKIKVPSITLEIGVNGCPLPISQFSGIWRRNHSLVLREARLFI